MLGPGEFSGDRAVLEGFLEEIAGILARRVQWDQSKVHRKKTK